MRNLSTKPAAGLRLIETVRADERRPAEMLVAEAFLFAPLRTAGIKLPCSTFQMREIAFRSVSRATNWRSSTGAWSAISSGVAWGNFVRAGDRFDAVFAIWTRVQRRFRKARKALPNRKDAALKSMENDSDA